MSLAEAVVWWDEWQLHVLVVCSLLIQFFLFFAGILRKRSIPSFLRFLVWLAYLGSDAVAIYALAILFSSTKKQEWVASHHHSSAGLQVLWAPILLMHLGGQDGITAYNIEDNELWRRHVVTIVSQVAVVIYVFYKSLSGDLGNLAEAFFLFWLGIVKCIFKPWELKKVSINSLIDSSSKETGQINSLHVYVRTAAYHFCSGGDDEGIGNSSDTINYFWKPYDVFVDLSPCYSDRLSSLKQLVRKQDIAHHLVQDGLSITFDRLYTKESLQQLNSSISRLRRSMMGVLRIAEAIYISGIIVRLSTSQVFIASYKYTDVTITFILLSCAAVMEGIIPSALGCKSICEWFNKQRHRWPDQVAQYNLIGYLARDKRRTWLRRMATLLGCKDLLDQLWSMEPSKSSPDITKLIHGYVARGWTEHHITDTPTYRAFNDNRGQWTLGREGCGGGLEWSLRRPFDESIILWHLATDLCFHRTVTPSSHETARRCREMSNYMAYLLFVKPDMLMTGARRSLFRAACKDVQRLLNEDLQQEGPENTLLDDERGLTQIIAQRAMITNNAPYIVHEARWLSTCLMALRNDDEDKMWRVIQGVWVEMLCFSAGRCRGYLHAKSLGSGGEYLSYVWLLLLYMGMETLTEKMQRTELHEDRMAAGLSSAAPMAATGDENV